MKKTGIIIFVFIVFSFLTPFSLFGNSPRQPQKFDYSVRFLDGEKSQIEVTLSFDGSASGKTEILLPSNFASVRDLIKGISEITVITKGARFVESDKPDRRIVNHRPGQKIRVRYRITQYRESADKGGRGGGYSPIVSKDYLHFIGHGGWVVPAFGFKTEHSVSIRWNGLPKGWAIANSFGAAKRSQTFNTSIEKFRNAIFVAGDFRLRSKKIEGKPVFVAVRGEWGFSDDQFIDAVGKIVESQREFWQDFDHPFYLVTILPLKGDPGLRSFGGTGLTNSFATFMTTNVKQSELEWLLAHEYFHNWNFLSFGEVEQPMGPIFWFTEGFTDYYTAELLKRTGLMSAEEYIAKHNELLRDYYLSPMRNITNERIAKEFFSDIRVTDQAYRRGFLLAGKWNRIIKDQSKGKRSLDDVMRAIFAGAKSGKHDKLNNESILNYLNESANHDFSSEIEKYVMKGETIVGFEGVHAECVDVSTSETGKFDLGFDFEKTKKERVLIGVSKNGPAYKNGLRDGQKVRGLSYMPDNIARLVEIKIEVDGETKEFKYLPVSTEKTKFPFYRIKSPDCVDSI